MHGMRFDDDRPDSSPYLRAAGGAAPAKNWLLATAGASLFGAAFSAVSTHDFISHLDRQVHTIHCSFIPGAGAGLGESGCRTVMMSPYSSWFRDSIWGGIPISLMAVAVFAYLVMHSLRLYLSGRG